MTIDNWRVAVYNSTKVNVCAHTFLKGGSHLPVTVKQIAAYAGVSRGTVDRVLNHRGGVKESVAKRVQQIADELGYQPNRAGKALANRKNPMQIGVILNAVGNPFYDQVRQGIEAAKADYRDFSVEVQKIELKGYAVEEQLTAIDDLVAKGVQSLIITPINDSRIATRLEVLLQEGLLVIKLNSDLKGVEQAPYIGCHYLKSGQTAAGLLCLCTAGVASVGIVTGSVKMLGHNQRVAGFLKEAKANFKTFTMADIVENNDDDEQSYRETKKLLQEHTLSALYFTAGGVAGGCRAVKESGQTPLVICCDDTAEIVSLIKEEVVSATICQQPFEQGYRAIQAIFNQFMTGEFPYGEYIFMQNQIKISANIEA